MKSSRTLLFICIVFAIMATLCICFPRDGINIGKMTLRFPSLHKVLVREKTASVEELMRQEEEERLMRDICDSIHYYHDVIDSSDSRFWFPNDDPAFFDPLFKQMETASQQGRTIRILHYGDSQIEMDRMTDRLRAYMQDTYGGGGPGMLPLRQTVYTRSVNQNASGSLVLQSSYGGDSTQSYRANGNYGLMARCWHMYGSATMNVSAAKPKDVPESFKRFSTVSVIFNNTGTGPLTATLSTRTSTLSTPAMRQCSSQGVHSFAWQLDSAATDIHLSLQGDGDIYCITVDDGPGVAVDNIALRGCSGQQFTMINADQLTEAYRNLDVGLIIMQFGGNSVPYIRCDKALEPYLTNLGRQIDRLHEACPDALILFIGPSDMSTTINGERHTYLYLPTMVTKLQQMANEHGAAYWSIYHAMGGKNSMVAWVNSGLAGSDYIHFSQKGVNLMGDRLAEAFQKMSDFYHLRKNIPAEQFDSVWRSR